MEQPTTEQLNKNINIKLTTPVECEKCKCQTFFCQQTVMLRNVSAIVSPSGKAGLLPLTVSFSCAACGHVNQQFLPNELRDNPIIKATSIVT